MRKFFILFSFLSGFATGHVGAQTKKIDTTATFGDAGYRVSCNNKKEDENIITVMPKGFKNTARDASFPVRGRLTEVLVDDLNDDGFPDLVLCIYTGAKHEIGTIFGISSVENNSLAPVSFPDIYNDPKLREGYKGGDEFTVMFGSLMRTFPIYKTGDTDKPTGGTRVVQYKIIPVADHPGAFAFKLLRSYEK